GAGGGWAGRGVKQTVVRVVQGTGLVARTDTNLGIILLLAPLAAVAAGEPLRRRPTSRAGTTGRCRRSRRLRGDPTGEPRPDGAGGSAGEDRRQALGPPQLARPWSGPTSAWLWRFKNLLNVP